MLVRPLPDPRNLTLPWLDAVLGLADRKETESSGSIVEAGPLPMLKLKVPPDAIDTSSSSSSSASCS